MSKVALDRVGGTIPFATAEDVATSIPADGALAISGFGSVGYPKAVPKCLAKDDRDLALQIVSGGSVGEVIDSKLMSTGAIARRYPYQAQPKARDLVNQREVAFSDRHIWGLGDEVAYGTLLDESYTAIVEAIAVGEDWYIPSTSIGPTPTFIASADRLVIELNESQPLELQQLHDIRPRRPPPHRQAVPIQSAGDRIGNAKVKLDPDKLEAVVQTDEPDSPYVFHDLTTEERGIGENLVRFLEKEEQQNDLISEKLHIQFGVGNVGNALASEIKHADLDEAGLVYYGEVIQDGLLNMIEEGILETASATSLALSREGQDRLYENLEMFGEHIVLRPSSISNNPSIINRFGIIGINSAVEVDIYGNANSTHINGSKLINGIGGSGDFIRHSNISVIALPSTAAGTSLSRIVPMSPHIDHTEHDIDIIITEQGIADLRGLSPAERAVEIIASCAHPDFESELREYYENATKSAGHIPHNLDTAFSMHQN